MLHGDGENEEHGHCPVGQFILQNLGLLLGFAIMLVIALYEDKIVIDINFWLSRYSPWSICNMCLSASFYVENVYSICLQHFVGKLNQKRCTNEFTHQYNSTEITVICVNWRFLWNGAPHCMCQLLINCHNHKANSNSTWTGYVVSFSIQVGNVVFDFTHVTMYTSGSCHDIYV